MSDLIEDNFMAKMFILLIFVTRLVYGIGDKTSKCDLFSNEKDIFIMWFLISLLIKYNVTNWNDFKKG